MKKKIKNQPIYKFMFAVVRKDEYGISIEIFKTRQNAQEFFIKVNKIKK